MIMLKTFGRTPSLAELKVSYKRGRGKDDRQEKMPWLISTPTTCEAYLRSVWDGATLELREEFLLVCLNGANEVLGWVEIATGGIDATLVDPRLVFAVALQVASAAIVVAHNHPSGNLRPSPEDIAITQKLCAGASLLGIRFLDHIILSADGAFSFASAGLLREIVSFDPGSSRRPDDDVPPPSDGPFAPAIRPPTPVPPPTSAQHTMHRVPRCSPTPSVSAISRLMCSM